MATIAYEVRHPDLGTSPTIAYVRTHILFET